MGHVGQKIGLVLARPRQILGFFFQFRLDLLQFAVFYLGLLLLLLQDLGLLGKLLVGRPQLLLLLLQEKLGFLKEMGLRLQLLVGGGEFLLLMLELLGLVEGDREQLFHLPARQGQVEARTEDGPNPGHELLFQLGEQLQ